MDAADRSSLPRRASSDQSVRAALPLSLAGLPPIAEDFWVTIDAGLAEIELVLNNRQGQALADHARLMMAWNAHINLSGLRSAEAIARGHVLDSLLAVAHINRLFGQPLSLIDLGSGAGYPGLPLAICLPVRHAALVDSIAKKASFLAAASSVVGAALNKGSGEGGRVVPEIHAVAERAENLAQQPDQRAAWDLVTARAVGTLAEVAELGLPLARRGGFLVAWKRDAGDGALAREIDQARPICQAVGGGQPRLVTLDGARHVGLEGHCLVVIPKQRATPDRYPRAVGERRRAALP